MDSTIPPTEREALFDAVAVKRLQTAVTAMDEYFAIMQSRVSSGRPRYPEEVYASQSLRSDLETVIDSHSLRSDDGREYKLSEEMREILKRSEEENEGHS